METQIAVPRYTRIAPDGLFPFLSVRGKLPTGSHSESLHGHVGRTAGGAEAVRLPTRRMRVALISSVPLSCMWGVAGLYKHRLCRINANSGHNSLEPHKGRQEPAWACAATAGKACTEDDPQKDRAKALAGGLKPPASLPFPSSSSLELCACCHEMVQGNEALCIIPAHNLRVLIQ